MRSISPLSTIMLVKECTETQDTLNTYRTFSYVQGIGKEAKILVR